MDDLTTNVADDPNKANNRDDNSEAGKQVADSPSLKEESDFPWTGLIILVAAVLIAAGGVAWALKSRNSATASGSKVGK